MVTSPPIDADRYRLEPESMRVGKTENVIVVVPVSLRKFGPRFFQANVSTAEPDAAVLDRLSARTPVYFGCVTTALVDAVNDPSVAFVQRRKYPVELSSVSSSVMWFAVSPLIGKLLARLWSV